MIALRAISSERGLVDLGYGLAGAGTSSTRPWFELFVTVVREGFLGTRK